MNYRRHNPRSLPRAVWEQREREAQGMFRAGMSRKEVFAAFGGKLSACRVKAIADALGVEKRRSGPAPGRAMSWLERLRASGGADALAKDVTSMSHAELDALEARVAEDRAAGRLPKVG